MPAHRLPADLSLSDFAIADPGNAGAIPTDTWGTVEISGGGTRTLARPTKTGTELTINGACTVTVAGGYNAALATSLVVTAGSPVVLKSVKDSTTTYAWRQIGSSDSPTFTTVTATTIAATSVSATNFNPGVPTTATQGTSVTTTVACAGRTGTITTFTQTLAAAARNEFTVTNSSVNDNSVISCTAKTAGTGTPIAYASNPVEATGFTMVLENKHASAALNNVVLITFTIFNPIAA